VPNECLPPIGRAVFGQPLPGELCSYEEEPDPGEFDGCDMEAVVLDEESGKPFCRLHARPDWWE
jgi:hypothetical protein